MTWTPDTWKTNLWPNFSFGEMACTHCGSNEMDPLLMDMLQQIRRAAGAMSVSSGYRCGDHPIERDKAAPGAHTFGKAVDIACRGEKALEVVRRALECGIQGIGVSQAGDRRFIHLDTMTTDDDGGRFPRPTIWSY